MRVILISYYWQKIMHLTVDALSREHKSSKHPHFEAQLTKTLDSKPRNIPRHSASLHQSILGT